MTPEEQIKKLADFISHEIPGEPSKSEGAVECAIRLLRDLVAKKQEAYNEGYRDAIEVVFKDAPEISNDVA